MNVQPDCRLHVFIVSCEHGVMVPTQLDVPVLDQ
jgi:hypothetical protein